MIMASTLGKRKREGKANNESSSSSVSEEDAVSESKDDYRDIFRRHFEAKYQPLDQFQLRGAGLEVEIKNVDSMENDGWEGFESEADEETDRVVVVEEEELTDLQDLSRAELKSFMVCSLVLHLLD